MDLYQEYIHVSRYARWRDDLQRRETWDETVQRYIKFFDDRYSGKYEIPLWDIAYPAILNMDVMPSMRALMTAGPALERENIAGYNCSYIAVNYKRAFAEALYVLLCGTGIGFSCERQEIVNLPEVPAKISNSNSKIVVEDSKEGWATAFHLLLTHLWMGSNPKVDYSLVRPAGARLHTFGGRASGPEPLKRLFRYVVNVFLGATKRKLTSIEVHDIMCMIGEIVVVGGVRRSALISLSNLSDQRMRDAKAGNWWTENPQRALANNSVAYTEKPSAEIFMQEWLSLIKSRSGERGIFNREAALAQALRVDRSAKYSYGCNPCSEIILRSRQFCNLTEIIVRENDDQASLEMKAQIASMLGTMQASLTNFGFLGEEWKKNCEEEALLGVSMTGIFDNPHLNGLISVANTEVLLGYLRKVTRATNATWAQQIGILPAKAVTCVKPSGTVSQLCNTASGIHPRHSKYYIRTARIDKKDPLYTFMLDKGFVIEDDVMKPESTAVVSFPIKAPDSSVTRNEVSAISSLELWKMYQEHWCDHKPSCTITVRDHEWLDVGAWVFKNFDQISGISFLPHSDHIYEQAPYQEVTKEEFEAWCKAHPMPEVDWEELEKYEQTDNTVGQQILACTGGSCEV